eukprot:1564875-Amphidinium_carterae.1
MHKTLLNRQWLSHVESFLGVGITALSTASDDNSLFLCAHLYLTGLLASEPSSLHMNSKTSSPECHLRVGADAQPQAESLPKSVAQFLSVWSKRKGPLVTRMPQLYTAFSGQALPIIQLHGHC